MDEMFRYKIVYTIFFTDGSQQSGELAFQSAASEADYIPFDDVLPHLKKIDDQYRHLPTFHGMRSEIVSAD